MVIGKTWKHDIFYCVGGEERNVDKLGVVNSEAFGWYRRGLLIKCLYHDDVEGLHDVSCREVGKVASVHGREV